MTEGCLLNEMKNQRKNGTEQGNSEAKLSLMKQQILRWVSSHSIEDQKSKAKTENIVK